jgi:hypothetical protein
MANYSERYVAFVDILNFRGIIESVSRGDRSADEVRGLLQAIHERRRPEAHAEEVAEFKAQSISDAVALSSACNAQGLDHIFYVVCSLAIGLLESGILIRGAITKGKLYHDDSAVFGEGLVSAYHLESQVARFPRILVARQVARDVEEYTKIAPLMPLFRGSLKQADDGPMYLNLFKELMPWIIKYKGAAPSSAPLTDAHLTRTRKMRAAIQQQFDASIDDPRIFEKLQWFAKYWNETVAIGITGVESIHGPGTAPKAFQ